MANQQKRGFLYIYKGGKGNPRKKNNELDQPSTVVEVGKKSNSLCWLTRISKARSLSVGINGGQRGLSAAEAGGGGGFVEGRKSTSCLELGSGGGYDEGRKSISAESALESGGVIVEGRKSVSHIESNLSAVRGIVIEGNRKSVSQIETLSSVTAYLQVKVLVTDMPSFMQVQAFRCARRTYDSLEKFSSKHIAHNIKKFMCRSLTKRMVRSGIVLWAQVLALL
ncbi:uncharacterized protein LOC129310171 isoform X2 [Prosopis cineraria]|uniref:uncharacterized protein LOC129310171 isoform X2 n=1 Tax=Prosopis cineraria TaxID=364024 RepID=UPI002410A604|nr:uncharacterized protein LOC129310171 isoform X2 [Prosopis cineraria]